MKIKTFLLLSFFVGGCLTNVHTAGERDPLLGDHNASCAFYSIQVPLDITSPPVAGREQPPSYYSPCVSSQGSSPYVAESRLPTYAELFPDGHCSMHHEQCCCRCSKICTGITLFSLVIIAGIVYGFVRLSDYFAAQ